MELKTEVKTYRIDKRCDKCKEGLMRCTGKGVTTWKTSWQHKCDKCGYENWFDQSYPFTSYKEIRKQKKIKNK